MRDGSPSAIRIILLGASNLTFAFPYIVARLRQSFESPIDILTAQGYGRSYGQWSQFLGIRELPGIVNCNLWENIPGEPNAKSCLALITDIGNDLMYGASAETVTQWVSICLRRLQRLKAAIVLVGLPIEAINTLSLWRYQLAKPVLFPASRVTCHSMRRNANLLNQKLLRLAEQGDVQIIEPESTWYGALPLHIRKKQIRPVWDRILSSWTDLNIDVSQPLIHPLERGRLWTLMPEHCRLFSRTFYSPQPTLRFSDKSIIELY